jgi:large conductance mechanosensitive channel
MLREFRAFIARGNAVDLAVGVVIGAAFTAIVNAVVRDFITPLIVAVFGKPDFSGLSFTINHSTFNVGDFINAVLQFLFVAIGVFLVIVKPMNALAARRAAGQEQPDPTHRPCPECLSDIPVAASRCAFCTSEVTPAAA